MTSAGGPYFGEVRPPFCADPALAPAAKAMIEEGLKLTREAVRKVNSMETPPPG